MPDKLYIGSKLSHHDIELLLENPDVENRLNTADKLSKQFAGGQFSVDEKNIAEDIFRIMLKDIEGRVRKALSVNLKSTAILPHDIAKTIAADKPEISAPFIQTSPMLTLEDLVGIVKSGDEDKQVAVANRKSVEEKLAKLLIEEGKERAVVALVSNDGAEIDEQGFNRVLDRFGDDNVKFHGPLIRRKNIPINITARLIDKVSGELQRYIVATYDLPTDVVSNLVLSSRDKTMVGLSHGAEDEQVRNLVRELIDQRRLTPSIMLRALCMGETSFFENALSELASVPVHNVRLLIYDAGRLGLKSLYEKAKMPGNLYPAFRAAVDVVKETDFDGLVNDQARFSRRVMERILTQVDVEQNINLLSTDIDFLLGKIGSLPGSYSQPIVD